jgi:iron(III) transport system permease protein
MARPLVAPASRPASLDVVGIAGVALLVGLAALIVYPVAALALSGLVAVARSVPLALLLRSVVIAAAAALAALAPAILLGYAVARVNVPGRTRLWWVCRAGVLLPSFVVPLALLVLAGPGGLVPGAFGPGGAVPEAVAIAIGQTLGLFPHAVALVVRALAEVPVQMEQAAETLGARRLTVVRRVTLGLAWPRLRAAALVLVVLGLSDVAAPMLLGRDTPVLATAIIGAAATSVQEAAGMALLLSLLVAAFGGAWRHREFMAGVWPAMPAVYRPAPASVRVPLVVVVGLTALVLPALWLLVPIGSVLRARDVTFSGWTALVTPAGLRSLGLSIALGLAAALAGALLALVAAWVVGRRRAVLGRWIDVVAEMPLAVPGVAAGAGYLLAFGVPSRPMVALGLAVLLVACWQLPATLRVARDVLARSDRSAEQAAVSLGAGRTTVARRVVVPALMPVAGWVLCDGFGAAVLAVGGVILFAGSGLDLGAVTLVTRAAAGANGAACAVATVLLALAGGAVLLGRTLAGRDRGFTLLA